MYLCAGACLDFQTGKISCLWFKLMWSSLLYHHYVLYAMSWNNIAFRCWIAEDWAICSPTVAAERCACKNATSGGTTAGETADFSYFGSMWALKERTSSFDVQLNSPRFDPLCLIFLSFTFSVSPMFPSPPRIMLLSLTAHYLIETIR